MLAYIPYMDPMGYGMFLKMGPQNHPFVFPIFDGRTVNFTLGFGISQF